MTEQLLNNDDKTLVSAVKSGDSTAFDEILNRHYNAVYLVALSRLRNSDAAEELTQETFVTAFIQLEALKDESRLPGWLCGIARNLAMRWLRDGCRQSAMVEKLARKYLPTAQQYGASGYDKVSAEQDRHLVASALEKLTDLEREAVLLHYVEGLSKRTLAERMSIHPSTAGRLLNRAVSSLKKHVLETLPTEVKKSVDQSAGHTKTALLIGAVAGLNATARAQLLVGQVASVPAVSTGLFSAMKIPAVIVALGLTGWIAGPTIVRNAYIMTLPEQQKKDFDRFENQPINFPVELTLPDSSTSRTKIYVQNLLTSSALNLLKKPPQSRIDESMKADIVSALDSLDKVVADPDYGVGDWASEYMHISGLQKLLTIWSDAVTSEGDSALGMRLALMPVKLAQRPKNCRLLDHLSGLTFSNSGVMQVARVAEKTTDSVLWQQAYDALNRLKPRVVHNYIQDYGIMLDVIAPLREYQAMGIPVDMSPGHPMIYYYEQVIEKRSAYLEKCLLMYAPGSAAYKQMEKELEVARKQVDITNTTAWQMGRVAQPNIEEAAAREFVVSARYDLTQMLLEQKLGLRTAGTTDPVKTTYRDPFTSGPYLRDKPMGIYYSIGPDKRDNGRKVIYDATNGTYSPGDIWLP